MNTGRPEFSVLEYGVHYEVGMWAFCVQSLFREYGWRFIRHVALPHPLRTARAVVKSGRLALAGSMVPVSEWPGHFTGGPGTVVGLGFCMKPMDCPSGRFNHDCRYLERLRPSMPGSCRGCAIGVLGRLALKAGSALYIMTSAQDILFDLFVPALEKRRFAAGLFLLCRYSLRPFSVGLLAADMSGLMVPFDDGDCRDYPTWLLADTGTKRERTCLGERGMRAVHDVLLRAGKPESPTRFTRIGHVFFPAAD